MKLSILFPVLVLSITRCIALPAPISTSTHVPVSQDPSPPRPFPAGRIMELNDPSPPRPFPKYPLDGIHPLEERNPLSRYPTDSEDEAHDPSPPRPFPAGHIVDVKNAVPPLAERDPSEPLKLVGSYKIATDPSPPRPFPKYPLDGDNRLEERDPLSRFPTNDEKEAADPSPPRPFPAGRLIEVNDAPSSDIVELRTPSPLLRTPEGSEAEAKDPSPPRPFPAGHLVAVKEVPPGDTIEPRTPSPLLRTTEGSAAEANDPSPPRPFPAGRFVETKAASPGEKIEPRSPSPLLRTPEGSEAEANDPSPPRPFPAGHPVDIHPRGEVLPPHHGGYFPPSNPPVPTPTAQAIEAFRDPPYIPCPHECPGNMKDCCWGPYPSPPLPSDYDPLPVFTDSEHSDPHLAPTPAPDADRATPLPFPVGSPQSTPVPTCTTT